MDIVAVWGDPGGRDGRSRARVGGGDDTPAPPPPSVRPRTAAAGGCATTVPTAWRRRWGIYTRAARAGGRSGSGTPWPTAADGASAAARGPPAAGAAPNRPNGSHARAAGVAATRWVFCFFSCGSPQSPSTRGAWGGLSPWDRLRGADPQQPQERQRGDHCAGRPQPARPIALAVQRKTAHQCTS